MLQLYERGGSLGFNTTERDRNTESDRRQEKRDHTAVPDGEYGAAHFCFVAGKWIGVWIYSAMVQFPVPDKNSICILILQHDVRFLCRYAGTDGGDLRR